MSREVDGLARCSAHGKTVAEHVDGYANDCTAVPSNLVERGCGDCETYGGTGLHWDTCPQRGRNSRPAEQLDAVLAERSEAPRDLASHWRRQYERLKIELDELQARQLTARQASASDPEIMALARIVAELQRLDDAERGRVLRYLNHRYMPSNVPETVRVVMGGGAGGVVTGRGGAGGMGGSAIVMNTPGGAPPR
jgi:hypothetical protein